MAIYSDKTIIRHILDNYLLQFLRFCNMIAGPLQHAATLSSNTRHNNA